MSGLNGLARNRLGLSLRWYEAALLDTEVDAFLKYWIDRVGRISKCGDHLLRTYLYEAAHALLTRTQQPSALRAWGLRIAKRTSLPKVTIAVARKLAVILHRMWVDDRPFAPNPESRAA
jgi:hypothetical protein